MIKISNNGHSNFSRSSCGKIRCPVHFVGSLAQALSISLIKGFLDIVLELGEEARELLF